MSEVNEPIIRMGNDNNNNTFQIFGMSIQTAILVGALLLNMGVQWSRAMETDALSRGLAAKVQVLETKVAQHDKAFEAVVDTNKEMKATVGEFNKTVNKLTETVARLDGKLSR